jgi:hypothetical protein
MISHAHHELTSDAGDKLSDESESFLSISNTEVT